MKLAFLDRVATRRGCTVPPSLLDQASWTAPVFSVFVRMAIGLSIRRALAAQLRLCACSRVVAAAHSPMPPPPPQPPRPPPPPPPPPPGAAGVGSQGDPFLRICAARAAAGRNPPLAPPPLLPPLPVAVAVGIVSPAVPVPFVLPYCLGGPISWTLPGRFPSDRTTVTAPALAASGCILVAAPPTAGSVLASVVPRGSGEPRPTVGSVPGPVLATVVPTHAPGSAPVPDP